MKEGQAEREVPPTRLMKAVRIHQFGGLEAIVQEEAPRPTPTSGQVLVQVKAAGVGPWDAWVRAGQSVLPLPLPLTLGSDLSGMVENIGPDVSDFQPGVEIFGVTNSQFTGAYAEYAVAEAALIARKPVKLSHVQAASVPVVATTAWQMVFDHGRVDVGKRVLVHGAAGNVGGYSPQTFVCGSPHPLWCWVWESTWPVMSATLRCSSRRAPGRVAQPHLTVAAWARFVR